MKSLHLKLLVTKVLQVVSVSTSQRRVLDQIPLKGHFIKVLEGKVMQSIECYSCSELFLASREELRAGFVHPLFVGSIIPESLHLVNWIF